MISFSARLDSISKIWPTKLRQELYKYLSCFQVTDKVAHDFSDEPYWLLLPSWLAQKYNRTRVNRIQKAVIDDIVWAQYCLFLTFRIKDDIYDQTGNMPRLLFTADIFMTEAFQVYYRYLRHSKQFWKLYDSYLRTTILAIGDVDAMQQRRSSSLKQIRNGYTRVCSVFKIGSAAVSALAGNVKKFRLIESAYDELAKAGQIFDDFQDMIEDLERGRLNYAVRFILGSSNVHTFDMTKISNLIATRLIKTNRTRLLFNEIKKHVEKANTVLNPLDLAPANQYLSEYTSSLDKIIEALGKEQARQIFSHPIG